MTSVTATAAQTVLEALVASRGAEQFDGEHHECVIIPATIDARLQTIVVDDVAEYGKRRDHADAIGQAMAMKTVKSTIVPFEDMV